MKVYAVLWCLLLSLSACQNNNASAGGTTTTTTASTSGVQQLAGKTMGTTYHISFVEAMPANLQADIDALLIDVNQDLSTYINDSYISKVNQAEDWIQLQPIKSTTVLYPHFQKVYYRSKEVYRDTRGLFDPTIMPLVNYWGFGYSGNRLLTSAESKIVEELRSLVGLMKIQERMKPGDADYLYLKKFKPGIQLDFSAIAKGYGVDVVAELLEQKGIQNYLVEIGGEVRAKGKNAAQELWTVGINTPQDNAEVTDFKAIVKLQDMALATSGNYRNFYELNGKKISHTINPRSGYSEDTNLLSASIFAKDCMTADAYATACMVMGLGEAFELIRQKEDMEGYFIYGTEEGGTAVLYTDGLKAFITNL